MMFLHYLYQSSTTQSFKDHFKTAAKKFTKEFKLNKDSYILDVEVMIELLKPFWI